MAHQVRTKRGTTPGGRSYTSTKWESGGSKGQYTEVFEKNKKTGGQKNVVMKGSGDLVNNKGKAKSSPKGRKITPIAKGPTKPVKK